MPNHYDLVQVRLVLDWSEMPPDMLIEEELKRLQGVISNALDTLYGNDWVVDLIFVTHEGKLGEDEEREGWGLSSDEIWDRLPGETKEEKREWVIRRMSEPDIDEEDL